MPQPKSERVEPLNRSRCPAGETAATAFESSAGQALGARWVSASEARWSLTRAVPVRPIGAPGSYPVRGELKEPDFDPLRGREDFKKLLAELEKK
jgi:hypothetical protein